MANPAKAALGEVVLVVPQAYAYYTNTHDERNIIGLPAEPIYPDPTDDRQPHWDIFTSTLMRKGIGVMVVRNGQLQVGPEMWDSGD